MSAPKSVPIEITPAMVRAGVRGQGGAGFVGIPIPATAGQ